MRKSGFWVIALLLLAGWLWSQHRQPPLAQSPSSPHEVSVRGSEWPTPSPATVALPAFLPLEARDTLRLIGHGGPFRHPQDGGIFGNREGRLPSMPRGYYREYTIETPGLDYRGARRIIAGGDPPVVYYYTDDHYNSFRAFEATQ